MADVAARDNGLTMTAFENLGLEIGEDIDWGSATPINHVAEVISDSKLKNAMAKCTAKSMLLHGNTDHDLPARQCALVLPALKQRFVLSQTHAVPEIKRSDELVVEIHAIGLNPIDWKSVDYGYGIPTLPYVAGRDFAGVVVKAPSAPSHIQLGDVVLCGSTDYRDQRKAAYQQYAIASEHTVCRLPGHVSTSQGAALGVAYIAASLALGVCLGVRFPKAGSGKGAASADIRKIVRRQRLEDLPQDQVAECVAMEEQDLPEAGEWIVIWGGSSTSALFLSQLARLAGLKVILVVDVAKHGARMVESRGVLLIDSHSRDRASQIIRGASGGKLRFGIDTVGKPTAEALAKCLQAGGDRKAHIVGLAALPKERLPGVVYHSVPVKLFHEVPEVGSSLMAWLEQALQSGILSLPTIETAPGGLEGINAALDRMRQGRISGKRLVVPLMS
ncbi:hypothetical protein AC579_2467 [Pseudocercospora musae]|uniref:Enoyl reductase (ER) domain-containing protein n=1 Tax=Pseudocercospora musae TaxID=113226 RepID=A0A139I610_9PEZI|nr:hypothetical protein AC579_2467 [Pseudocercospora musae]